MSGGSVGESEGKILLWYNKCVYGWWSLSGAFVDEHRSSVEQKIIVYGEK